MIRTFSARLRVLGRSPIGCGSLAAEAGDTIIEVLISALLVGLIVVATLTGFNVTSGASASERARAQADALAQQAEDRLRGLSLAKLQTLQVEPLVEEVTQNGIKYKITSTAEYHIEEGTSSCNSASTSAGYYRTSSTVTGPWQSAKNPVVETGIISPPPGSALLVQVTGTTGEGVGGMTVTAAGPAPTVTPHTLSTPTNGCAILVLLPGEYTINVSQPGYVDENWYAKSEEDPHSVHSVYLTAETSAKQSYRFALAGTLEVKFNGSKPEEGDSFVASNIGMKSPAFRAIPSPSTLETYKPIITSETKVFPFAGEGGKYAVYAGTCESDNPKEVNAANKVETVTVPPGGTGKVTVTQPPINIRVMSGKKKGAEEGKPVEKARVTLTDKGEGCEEVKRISETNSKGGLLRPGSPFGEYVLCVTAKNRKYTTALFENDTPAGPSKLKTLTNGGLFEELPSKINYAVIYMEGEGSGGGETCP